jgi:electron transfer flavoprotein beta subunit
MHIIIPMKRVPDTETRVAVLEGQVDPGSLKTWIINPYDEYAIEEALRLLDREGGGKITIVTIGPEAAQETIRKALAMGADEAYHLQDPAFERLDPLGRARILAAAIQKIGEYDLIWTGWKGVDEDHGQTAILLAEFLDLPQVSTVITVEEVGDGHVVVTSEAEGGYQKVRVQTPAVLTESQGPNEPRYPSLKGIMGAKKKPMTVWTAADLDVDLDEFDPLLELIHVEKPPARAAGRLLDGEPADAARELVRLLHEEARVI